jgi:hypothetical protein
MGLHFNELNGCADLRASKRECVKKSSEWTTNLSDRRIKCTGQRLSRSTALRNPQRLNPAVGYSSSNIHTISLEFQQFIIITTGKNNKFMPDP